MEAETNILESFDIDSITDSYNEIIDDIIKSINLQENYENPSMGYKVSLRLMRLLKQPWIEIEVVNKYLSSVYKIKLIYRSELYGTYFIIPYINL